MISKGNRKLNKTISNIFFVVKVSRTDTSVINPYTFPLSKFKTLTNLEQEWCFKVVLSFFDIILSLYFVWYYSGLCSKKTQKDSFVNTSPLTTLDAVPDFSSVFSFVQVTLGAGSATNLALSLSGFPASTHTLSVRSSTCGAIACISGTDSSLATLAASTTSSTASPAERSRSEVKFRGQIQG